MEDGGSKIEADVSVRAIATGGELPLRNDAFSGHGTRPTQVVFKGRRQVSFTEVSVGGAQQRQARQTWRDCSIADSVPVTRFDFTWRLI
jgi:hypothetical protein